MHFPPSETLTTVVTTPSSSGTSPSASAIFPGGSKPPDLVLSTGGLDTPGRQKWTGVLKDLPKRGWSRIGTPTASTPGTPNTDTDEWLGEKERVWDRDERKEKERKRRRKKAEIYVSFLPCDQEDLQVLTRLYSRRSLGMWQRSSSARSLYASLHGR